MLNHNKKQITITKESLNYLSKFAKIVINQDFNNLEDESMKEDVKYAKWLKLEEFFANVKKFCDIKKSGLLLKYINNYVNRINKKANDIYDYYLDQYYRFSEEDKKYREELENYLKSDDCEAEEKWDKFIESCEFDHNADHKPYDEFFEYLEIEEWYEFGRLSYYAKQIDFINDELYFAGINLYFYVNF